ncbi:integrase [Pantoea ananatis]
MRIHSARFIDLAPASKVRENNHSGLTIALREKQMIMNPPGLQNAPERVTALHFAPGADFATAVALRRMATANGVTPFYLLAPEVSALLYYMPDRRHHFLFSTLWNTGARIGEACTLRPESFELDGPRPFVRILSEKVRSRRGRPPKDAVRLVPLTDAGYRHGAPQTP